MTKTIELRHTQTFIAIFISSLFYIFPKFLSEIRVNCFYNQNKVNVLCCSKIQSFFRHQNVTRRSSNDGILLFTALEPFLKAINPRNHLFSSTVHSAFLLLLLQPAHLHLLSMPMPKKARLQYFVWTIFVDCISTSLRPPAPANSANY
ncbi:unknown [Clostridium sp. CAG:299]|nr:unknown [Clostridium sp. CAG:299]